MMMNFHKYLYRPLGSTIARFNLIGAGNSVLVALSGGRDSLVMTDLLLRWAERTPFEVSVQAVHVDLWENREAVDAVTCYCSERNIPVEVVSHPAEMISARIRESNKSPCYVCARERRLIILKRAEEKGMDRIAFGHHLYDFMESSLMNMFFSGSKWTMPVREEFFGGKLVVIRPMVFIEAEAIEQYSRVRKLETGDNNCPYSDSGARKKVRQFVRETCADPYARASARAFLRTEYSVN